MTRFILLIILLVTATQLAAQAKTDSVLQQILLTNHDPLFKRVLKGKDSFRVQVIYTQINRDHKNVPSCKNYYYNVDSNLYFNPASTVKLPLALLALEKLNTLQDKGIDKFTHLQIDSNNTWQTAFHYDSTAPGKMPTIAHFIKKAFLVSDNDAYNRLYQFVGQQGILKGLYDKGYKSTRILRQFLGLTMEANRYTNATRFVNKQGKLLYYQPPAYNPHQPYTGKIITLGSAHYNQQDSLVQAPIDFSQANHLPLEDLQQLLQSIVLPTSVPAVQRFNLGPDDYQFLYQYLSQYPSETNYPKYDTGKYYDSYVKFYFRDSTHRMPPRVRVFNKVGWAYGFLTDVSYVVDFANKVEFMLTTTLYVNSDGILNDGKYDYESIGWPFLYLLGQTIYQYDLKRPRNVIPNLQQLVVPYETRDTKDQRVPITAVDN